MRRLSRTCNRSGNLADWLPKGCQKQKMRRRTKKLKVPKPQRFRDFFVGLGEKIRTSGLLNPIQARYQTAPHPVTYSFIILAPLVAIVKLRANFCKGFGEKNFCVPTETECADLCPFAGKWYTE